jgi:hypothetical protein
METFIKDSSIPSGSVILAYGAPAPRSRIPKILALVAGIFGMLGVLAIAFLLFCVRVPAPSHPIAVAFIPASMRIPDGFPQLWQHAQRSSEPFPVFVGFTQEENGALRPFALTPHIFRWSFEGDAPHPTSTTSLASLSGHVSNYIHGAWLALHWNGTRINGPLTSHGWKTDYATAPPSPSIQSFVGDGYINLRAFPEAGPYIAPSLSALDIDPSLLGEALSVRWTHGATSTGIAFDITDPISRDQAVRIGEAAGLADQRETLLQDGSTLSELYRPDQLFATSTAGTWDRPMGGSLRIEERQVTIENGSIHWNETAIPSTCAGNLLFSFEEGLFPVRLFGIQGSNQKLNVCW